MSTSRAPGTPNAFRPASRTLSKVAEHEIAETDSSKRSLTAVSREIARVILTGRSHAFPVLSLRITKLGTFAVKFRPISRTFVIRSSKNSSGKVLRPSGTFPRSWAGTAVFAGGIPWVSLRLNVADWFRRIRWSKPIPRGW